MQIRRKMLSFGLYGAAIVALAVPAGAGRPQPVYDTLIRGGTIYSGDAAPFVGDVAITGARMV